jgi:formylglycine-generating enzyme required for sulfatase activity
VETEDIREILPAVMSHRIKPNRSAQAEDRWAWVKKLWQKAMDRYDERERDADRLTLARLKEELKTIPLKDQPARIEQYREEYAQAMDGSSGIEEFLAMKMLYKEVMKKIRKAKVVPTARPMPPRPPGPAGGGDKNILTPEQVLAMHRAGKTPPIGSMIRLPGGEFEAGNPFEGEGSDDERPVHRVKISPLLISPYSVTNAEFNKFIMARGYSTDKYWSEAGGTWKEENSIVQPDEWKNPRFNQPNQPVVGVSHYEAEAYLNWANMRFPTEHEWEYAGRGGLRGKRYPWGDEAPTGPDVIGASRAHFGQDWNTGAAVEVNTTGFAPNRFGLYHIAGNVWERVLDWYASEYYQELAAKGLVENPKGPETGSRRVLRGGSWYGSAVSLRVTCRSNSDPGERNDGDGFRAARTLDL